MSAIELSMGVQPLYMSRGNKIRGEFGLLSYGLHKAGSPKLFGKVKEVFSYQFLQLHVEGLGFY